MTGTIVRYPLPFPSAVDRSFTIDMPEGAKVVRVGVADTKPREPSMWVEQTDTWYTRRKFYNVAWPVPLEPRKFYSVGVEFAASAEAWGYEYIGSWEMNGNTWHIFEAARS